MFSARSYSSELPMKAGHGAGSYSRFIAGIALNSRLRGYWVAVIGVTAGLIGIDLCARLMRLAGWLTVRQSEYFVVSGDYTFAELVSYPEMALAAVLLYVAALRLGDAKLRLWAVLVSYILIDDMFLIHDHARLMFGHAFFSMQTREQAEEFGELLYYAGVALVVVPAFAFSYWRANRQQFTHAALIAIPVFMFGFFATVIDSCGDLMLHAQFISERFYRMWDVFEDGGELISSGLILMAAAALYLLPSMARHERLAPSLKD